MIDFTIQKYRTKRLKFSGFAAAFIQFVLQTGGKLVSAWAVTAAGMMMIPSASISIYNSYRRLAVIALNNPQDPKQGYRQATEKARLRGQILSDSLKLLAGLLSLGLMCAVFLGAGSLATQMMGYMGTYIVPGIMMFGVSYRLGWTSYKQSQSSQAPAFEGNKTWVDLRKKKTFSAVVAFTMYTLSLGLTLLAPVIPAMSSAVLIAGYVSSGVTALILSYWSKHHYQGLQKLKSQLPEIQKIETSNDSPVAESPTVGLKKSLLFIGPEYIGVHRREIDAPKIQNGIIDPQF